MYAARDGVAPRKRNLEAVEQREREKAEEAEVRASVEFIRKQSGLWLEYRRFPVADAWLRLFKTLLPRYPILILQGPSRIGKTEWAKSLFKNPLPLEIGTKPFFPEKMRTFRRGTHDGIILDDVRDLQFLSDHQEKLQATYDRVVEFASTPGGGRAYSHFLSQIPIVVTVNFSTCNLGFLEPGAHDWLGNEENRVLIELTEKPFGPASSSSAPGPSSSSAATGGPAALGPPPPPAPAEP
jgi:hypothetical protein